jgi:hypothetical protein
MKLSPFYNRSRDLAITVKEGERVVFSDPLSRTLFSEEAPPSLPYGDKEGRLIEGAKPYLLIRRELSLPKRQFAVYAALPLAKSETCGMLRPLTNDPLPDNVFIGLTLN